MTARKLVLLVLVLLMAGCTRNDTNTAKNKRATVLNTTTVLATLSANEQNPETTQQQSGMHSPIDSISAPLFSELGGGVAYSVHRATYSYVVHNGAAGQHYPAIGEIALSPDGKRNAYAVLTNGTWNMLVDNVPGKPFNAIKSPVFSPDGKHIAYKALSGEKWYLVVDDISNNGTDTRITEVHFNADSTHVAYIDTVNDQNIGQLVVSDIMFKNPHVLLHDVSHSIVNSPKNRLVGIKVSGSAYSAFSMDFSPTAKISYSGKYKNIQRLVFDNDDTYPVYAAYKDGKNIIVNNSQENMLPPVTLIDDPVVCKNKTSALVTDNKSVFMFPNEHASPYIEANGLVYNDNCTSFAYTARSANQWILVTSRGTGEPFDKIVTPKFSPDGRFVIYRARSEGKRFIVIADNSGKTVKKIQPFELVYDVIFTEDGKSIAYGVKDGSKLIWRVDPI
jgi:roadblock/LC7 domain-containing protein